MNYRDLKNDYPEIFDLAINDLDWDYIFKILDSGDHDLLQHYLSQHFIAYIETVDKSEPEPDHDRKRETAAINFETAAFLTNMNRDQ